MQLKNIILTKNHEKICYIEYQFYSLCECQIPRNLAPCHTHFLAIFELLSIYNSEKTPKNGQYYHLDGSLRHKIMLNDDRLAWIYAWMCVSARTLLFDHYLTKATVLDPKKWQKCHFSGILRHFTNIYGNEMRLKPNSMFWNSVVCVSLGPNAHFLAVLS